MFSRAHATGRYLQSNSFQYLYFISLKYILILAVPGHALLWLTRLNGKERKEKAHISNMFNFTMNRHQDTA
jgi:hypothetical protein